MQNTKVAYNFIPHCPASFLFWLTSRHQQGGICRRPLIHGGYAYVAGGLAGKLLAASGLTTCPPPHGSGGGGEGRGEFWGYSG